MSGWGIFGAVSDLLQMGNANANARRDRRFNRDVLNTSRQQFNAQMDESIQRRVKDAQAAGIHPLFALGASVGASPTTAVGNTSPGRTYSAGRGIAGLGAALAEAQIRATNAEAEKSESEAALADSEAATLRQTLASAGRDIQAIQLPDPGTTLLTGKGPNEYYGPALPVNPEVPVSQSVGVRAGNEPGMVRMQLPDGRTVDTYNPELGLDEIGQLNYVIQRSRHYVADALTAARPYLSDGAILGFLQRLVRKAGTTGNTNPPGSGHRARRKKPQNRRQRRK